MSREEFLTELRKALQGRVSQQTVNDNLRYYEEYILTESHKGKTEAEVIAELGNPSCKKHNRCRKCNGRENYSRTTKGNGWAGNSFRRVFF